jgi:geranyl-CoA carboxylase alpha subunit
MNTRLQVEHPVTELITGLDLVAWQLMVAAGEPLPLKQEEIVISGHAVEVRLYAEDPRHEFMPQTGRVLRWHVPHYEGVRVDHGIQESQSISAHYDPMLAKIIAIGYNRETAIRRLASAVQDTQLLGVNSNKHFLHCVLRHSAFLKGEATTAFIERYFNSPAGERSTEPGLATLARAALLYYQRSEYRSQSITGGWRSASASVCQFILTFNNQNYPVQLTDDNGRYTVELASESVELRLVTINETHCVVVEDTVREAFCFAFDGNTLYLDNGTGHFCFDDITHNPAVVADSAGSGQLKASMDGVIRDVLVKEGETVEQGQPLLILEAMKMELPLKSGVTGIVKSISTQLGQQVKSKQLLATIVECATEMG